jgi:mono/diheme cytochrome c family protein
MGPEGSRGTLVPPGARLAVAALVPIVLLGSAYGLARGIQRRASLTSHQQATPEDWIGASTPTSPRLVAQGHKAFLASCAHCHGADASGDEGPDLHGLEVSDRHISATIMRGIKGEMPSFRKKLEADDVAALTAYLRSLR